MKHVLKKIRGFVLVMVGLIAVLSKMTNSISQETVVYAQQMEIEAENPKGKVVVPGNSPFWICDCTIKDAVQCICGV